MALIEWKDTLSVSVSKYDEQHKKLISLINQLHEAMSAGKGKDVLEKVLSDLIAYTKNHFADEEAELKKNNYMDFLNHKKEHDKLTMEVVKFYDEFKAGRTSITVEILSFLRFWLQDHIMKTDKKYGAFLQSKGVK